MADDLCKKFMEKVGDQHKEEWKKDQARHKKLEDDLKKEKETRNRMVAEQTEKAEKKVKELAKVVEELKKKPASSSTISLPNPLDLPPTQSNNPWIGGDRISIMEDNYANVPLRHPAH